MSNLYYFNSDLELQFIMNNEKPGACHYEEAAHTEGLDLVHELEFKAPADHPEAEQLAEGGYIGLFDKDNDFQLFEVYLIEEEDTFEGLKRHVFADHVFAETAKLPIIDKRPQNTTALAALTSALQGQTKWKVGQVAELGNNSTNFYYESIKSAVIKILEIWGGELKTRITFNNNKITGFYIDILARRGADTGKRITIEKDAESIKRKVDFTNIYTAIYPRGKGVETEGGGYSRRLTIEEIAWTTAGGNPVDKPAGQEWIGNEEARLKYGISDGNGGKLHRFLILNFDEVEDPNILINSGWETLQQYLEPLFNYEAKVADLEAQGLSHEAVRLGDTNFVLDDNFKPMLATEARIIRLKRMLDDESQTEITLGNFLSLFTDQEKKSQEFQDKIGGMAGVWTNPITDTDIEDITPEKPLNVTTTGLFKKVLVEWEYKPYVYIANYEVYGSQVPGFLPDSSNLLWKGKNGIFEHVADVNQQWYYKVRAVNTHGTAGPYSDEVTGLTLQINAETDIVPLTITNELIAENALIDSAKIGDISAAKIKTGTLNANEVTVKGGTDQAYSLIDSQGFTAVNGAFRVQRPDGYMSIQDGILRNSFAIQGSEPPFQTLSIEKYGQFYRTNSNARLENVQRFSFKHDSRYVRIIANLYADGGVQYGNVANMAFDVFSDDETVSIASTIVTESRHSTNQGYRKDILIDLGTPTGNILVMYWRMWNTVSPYYCYGSVRYLVQEG